MQALHPTRSGEGIIIRDNSSIHQCHTNHSAILRESRHRTSSRGPDQVIYSMQEVEHNMALLFTRIPRWHRILGTSTRPAHMQTTTVNTSQARRSTRLRWYIPSTAHLTRHLAATCKVRLCILFNRQHHRTLILCRMERQELARTPLLRFHLCITSNNSSNTLDLVCHRKGFPRMRGLHLPLANRHSRFTRYPLSIKLTLLEHHLRHQLTSTMELLSHMEATQVQRSIQMKRSDTGLRCIISTRCTL